MKSSIKFLAFIALFFTFNFAVNAQRGGEGRSIDPEQMAEKQTTRMVESLNLDEAQTAKVKEINLAYAERLQAAREENNQTREAMQEIRTAIQTEKTAEIQVVLTEEQFTTYKEMQAQRERRGEGKGPRGGGRRGNK